MNAAAHRVGIVLVPDCTQMGHALTVEPMFVANWLAGRAVFAWRVLSLDGLSVRSSNGSGLPVDGALAEPEAFDTVIVVASFDSRAAAADPRLLNWLRRAARFGARIAGVETGSEVIAAAGLLAGHQAAVHWYNRDGFAARFPEVEIADGRVTSGRGRMTAAGGVAAAQMMLALVAEVADAALADEVARHLLIDPGGPRPAQAPTATDAAVAAALARIARIDENAPRLADLAAAAGLSARQLQRRFRAATGLSPGRAAAEARLARAHQLVQQTAMSVTEIAIACGFGSPEHFSRSYRRRFGRAPREDRRQSVSGSVRRIGPGG